MRGLDMNRQQCKSRGTDVNIFVLDTGSAVGKGWERGEEWSREAFFLRRRKRATDRKAGREGGRGGRGGVSDGGR
jgi:hypothetical protein